MPMPKKLLDILTEKLGDSKFGDDDKGIVSIMVNTYNDAEKLETDNKAIIAERDDYKGKYKTSRDEAEEANTNVTNLTKENETLKENQKSDKDKKIIKSGLSEEMQAEFNTMKKTNDENQLKIKELETTNANKEIETKKTNLNLAEVKLYSDISKALDDAGIKKAENQSLIKGVIKTEEMAKLTLDEETGVYNRSFKYTENGSVFSFKDTKELAEHMQKTYAHLVDGSGKTGPGASHTNDKNHHENGDKKGYTTQDAKSMLFPKKE